MSTATERFNKHAFVHDDDSAAAAANHLGYPKESIDAAAGKAAINHETEERAKSEWEASLERGSMATMGAAASMASLPPECLAAVLVRLDAVSLLRLEATCKWLRQQASFRLVQDSSLWRTLAVHHFGTAVLEGSAGNCKTLHTCASRTSQSNIECSWRQFYLHRVSHCTALRTTSPLDLIQEHYTDPWQHIACCLLCSRTSGGQGVGDVITHILEAHPNATAVLQADVDTLRGTLDMLGLQDVRMKALQAMSHSFLHDDWTDPTQFHGCVLVHMFSQWYACDELPNRCGAFISESWRIFCCGDTRSITNPTLAKV
eukprot:jgi/Chlat1/2512/Chrsp175S02375